MLGDPPSFKRFRQLLPLRLSSDDSVTHGLAPLTFPPAWKWIVRARASLIRPGHPLRLGHERGDDLRPILPIASPMSAADELPAEGLGSADVRLVPILAGAYRTIAQIADGVWAAAIGYRADLFGVPEFFSVGGGGHSFIACWITRPITSAICGGLLSPSASIHFRRSALRGP